MPESKLDRKTSVGVGLATMALVYGIYDQTVPATIDVRVQQAGDRDLAAAEKNARWISGAVVAGIALITMDATVFIMGAGMVIALSWSKRHANYCDPTRGTSMPSSRQILDQGNVSAGYSPSLT